MTHFISRLLFPVWVFYLFTQPVSQANLFSSESNDPIVIPEAQTIDHRYVIFLAGINSKSSEKGPPLENKYKVIIEGLKSSGFKDHQFVYFSFGAATSIDRGELMCAGWGSKGCSNDPSADLGDLTNINFSPQYKEADTKVSLYRQASALNWLIGQVVKNDPDATIDLIGFSLGGITSSLWAVENFEEDYSNHVRSIILINSPVGGIPGATAVVHDEELLQGELIVEGLKIWFGKTILTELQLPVDGWESESIVDELENAPNRFPMVSIQSDADYMVNRKTFDIEHVGNGVLVGNGTQYWRGIKNFHSETLGGYGLAEVPLPPNPLTIFDFVNTNHNAATGHSKTRDWIVEAITEDSNNIPVNPQPVFNAASSNFAYDTVIQGEDATLRFELQNTGKQTWINSSTIFQPSDRNDIQNLPRVGLNRNIQTQETYTFEVNIPANKLDSKVGMIPVNYQLRIDGNPIGDEIKGYVIVLPDAASGLEEKIQQTIDAWVAAGEEKIQELIDQIWADIQKELEEQALTLLENLLAQCQGAFAVLAFGLGSVYFRKKKKPNR